MAILLQQQPTSPAMVNSNLVYTVTSSQYTQPQFQYVVDIKTTGGTLIQRIKQQPNPTGYGVFDISQILVNELSVDTTWKAAPWFTSSYAAKSFVVAFGEEYGTSTSSSVTSYTGIGSATGSASVSSSIPAYFVNGIVEPNEAINWNFPSASYFTASAAPNVVGENYSLQHALTSAPYSQSMNDGDYGTIGIFNGNFNGAQYNAQDIYWLQVNVYNAAGTNIQNFGYFNLNSGSLDGGPRTGNTQEWDEAGVYDIQTDGTKLLYVGIGPQNFDDAGNTLNTAWAYYSVTLWGQESAGVESNDGSYARYWITKQDCSGFTPLRFAWKNEFGVWDYYNFTKAQNVSSAITRESYDKVFVNFSTTTSTTAYDKTRRGNTQYYNEIDKNRQANTDWLTQSEADWLRELFYSTNVYIQEGSEFLPVIIKTASITEKTNNLSQKVFQYAIDWDYANTLRPRL